MVRKYTRRISKKNFKKKSRKFRKRSKVNRRSRNRKMKGGNNVDYYKKLLRNYLIHGDRSQYESILRVINSPDVSNTNNTKLQSLSKLAREKLQSLNAYSIESKEAATNRITKAKIRKEEQAQAAKNAWRGVLTKEELEKQADDIAAQSEKIYGELRSTKTISGYR